MIHIKLHDRRDLPKNYDDPMGRTWVGYDPRLSPQELFAQNRGRWVLGSRADREDYVAFSYTGDHTIKFVVAIDGWEPVGERKAIVGHVLDPDDPVAVEWVGAPAPDNHRNPTTYFEHTGPGTSICACGCGEPVPPKRAFLPGHDQKAIHARIAQQWGDTLGFIKWFDAEYATDGKTG
ncbi:MAG: hypothetical protein Q7T55_25455 [Solirubrobacteraceae bacterium]|nr:hypothetical protein [Solirubrobacteraceae bacterium]